MRALLPHREWLVILALITIGWGGPAVSENESHAGYRNDNRSFWVFGAVDQGFTSLSTPAGEVGKSGYYGAIKLLAPVIYTNRFVLDVGVGWWFSNVSGTDATNKKVRIRTSAMLVEVAPRYRLTERWQVGLVGQALFGTDLSFDEKVGGKSLGLLLGPQALYEFPVGTGAMRVGAQYLTDLNVTNRQAHFFQATVQFGFPIGGRRSNTYVVKADRQVTLFLGSELLTFDTAKSELRPEAKAFLDELSKVLNKNTRLWENVRIEGHTDSRGKFEMNQKLSGDRAKAVLTFLTTRRVQDRSLASEGYADTRPRDPGTGEEAWTRNRRVELVFQGVSDTNQFGDVLTQVYKAHLKPTGPGEATATAEKPAKSY